MPSPISHLSFPPNCEPPCSSAGQTGSLPALLHLFPYYFFSLLSIIQKLLKCLIYRYFPPFLLIHMGWLILLFYVDWRVRGEWWVWPIGHISCQYRKSCITFRIEKYTERERGEPSKQNVLHVIVDKWYQKKKEKSRWNPVHQWRGQPQRGLDAASTVTGRRVGGTEAHRSIELVLRGRSLIVVEERSTETNLVTSYKLTVLTTINYKFTSYWHSQNKHNKQ